MYVNWKKKTFNELSGNLFFRYFKLHHSKVDYAMRKFSILSRGMPSIIIIKFTVNRNMNQQDRAFVIHKMISQVTIDANHLKSFHVSQVLIIKTTNNIRITSKLLIRGNSTMSATSLSLILLAHCSRKLLLTSSFISLITTSNKTFNLIRIFKRKEIQKKFTFSSWNLYYNAAHL